SGISCLCSVSSAIALLNSASTTASSVCARRIAIGATDDMVRPIIGRLRIATYNVNGVNGRLPRLLEWLEEPRPDVACLQEIKTTDEKCPAEAVMKAGYHSLWRGQRSHHGVAVLTRGSKARERRRALPGNDEDA